MKTTLIAVLFLFAFTTLNFAQETGAGYTDKIQPITISQISTQQYKAALTEAYVDILGDILEHPDIKQSSKMAAMDWTPEIKMMNGKNIKGILIFPQGTITVNKKKQTTVTLSDDFNEWTGNGFTVWRIIPILGSVLAPNPAYDLK